jgi:hypothetical protein
MPRSGQWRFAQACRAYEAAAQFSSIAQLNLTTAPPNADSQPRWRFIIIPALLA